MGKGEEIEQKKIKGHEWESDRGFTMSIQSQLCAAACTANVAT